MSEEPNVIIDRSNELGLWEKLLNQFSYYRWVWSTTQAAQQLARLMQLNDTRAEQESESWHRITFILPQLVFERLAAP